MRTLYYLFTLILLFSCTSKDLEYVKTNTWEYGSGFKIGDGDMVDFNGTHYLELKGDTIFIKGTPRALIKSTNKKRNENYFNRW